MVKLVNHPALVQRQVQLFSPLPSIALNGVEARQFQLLCSSEEMRVGCHIEEALSVANGPCRMLTAVRTVDQDGMTRVDASGNLRITPCAEDGSGAGVGVDQSEVGRGQREAPVWIFDRLSVGEEEGAVSLRESPLRTAENEGTELE